MNPNRSQVKFVYIRLGLVVGYQEDQIISLRAYWIFPGSTYVASRIRTRATKSELVCICDRAAAAANGGAPASRERRFDPSAFYETTGGAPLRVRVSRQRRAAATLGLPQKRQPSPVQENPRGTDQDPRKPGTIR